MIRRIPFLERILVALAIVVGPVLCAAGTDSVTVFAPAEQNRLEREYAGALKSDIIRTLERITGADTVAATVRASVDWEIVEETYREWPWRGIVRRQGLVVNGLDVGVLIDDKKVKNRAGQMMHLARSPAEMKKITDLIRVIVGYDKDRGDRLIVQNYPLKPLRRSINPKKAGYGILLLIGGLMLGILSGIAWRKHKSVRPFIWGEVLYFVRHHPDLAIRILRRWLDRKARPNPRQYAPAEQVGVILLSLGQSEMRKILNRMSPEEIRLIKEIIARLGRVTGRDIHKCLTLFYKEMAAPVKIGDSLNPASGVDLIGEAAGVSGKAATNPEPEAKEWADVLKLSADKIRQLLVYCDKTVLAAALKDEPPVVRKVFSGVLSPDLWQSVVSQMASIQACPEAKEILLKTAQELGLFG